MKYIAFVLTAVFASTSFAAPIPGSTSSKVVSPEIGLYRSPNGFTIAAGNSGWSLASPPKDSKHISAVYAPRESTSVAEQMKADLVAKADIVKGRKAIERKPAQEMKAALTVRVDDLKKDTTLDKYIQRWMKEYPRYGFDVLGSGAFAQKNQRGYVLDLLNRDQKKQLRQVVFLKNKKAVILTCRDQQSSFKNTLKSCNEIIRNFNWTM
ncbi:MAG: hypothetical protein AAB250_11905 [Bdellovibrionota bacterium]